jgi:hypothetical protein
MKVWRRKSWKGIYREKRKKGRPKKRWIQDVTDDSHMDESDAGHLAYDRMVFRRALIGAKFCQGHATESI